MQTSSVVTTSSHEGKQTCAQALRNASLPSQSQTCPSLTLTYPSLTLVLFLCSSEVPNLTDAVITIFEDGTHRLASLGDRLCSFDADTLRLLKEQHPPPTILGGCH